MRVVRASGQAAIVNSMFMLQRGGMRMRHIGLPVSVGGKKRI
jgi:hypothetical protein